jgi:hypothetical protein
MWAIYHSPRHSPRLRGYESAQVPTLSLWSSRRLNSGGRRWPRLIVTSMLRPAPRWVLFRNTVGGSWHRARPPRLAAEERGKCFSMLAVGDNRRVRGVPGNGHCSSTSVCSATPRPGVISPLLPARYDPLCYSDQSSCTSGTPAERPYASAAARPCTSPRVYRKARPAKTTKSPLQCESRNTSLPSDRASGLAPRRDRPRLDLPP